MAASPKSWRCLICNQMVPASQSNCQSGHPAHAFIWEIRDPDNNAIGSVRAATVQQARHYLHTLLFETGAGPVGSSTPGDSDVLRMDAQQRERAQRLGPAWIDDFTFALLGSSH
jgi:hypothetical protein